jgi:hypothetical protein
MITTVMREEIELALFGDCTDPETGEALGVYGGWMDNMQALVGVDRDLLDVGQDEWDLFAPMCDRLEIAERRLYG